MDSVDLQVLKTSLEWRVAGHEVILGTIVQTWGSSPRPPGAMLAIRDDGLVAGSISGGCIEDDMINRVRDQSLEVDKPSAVTYGISKEEANRFGLPCGGTLQVVLEKITDFVEKTQNSTSSIPGIINAGLYKLPTSLFWEPDGREFSLETKLTNSTKGT